MRSNGPGSKLGHVPSGPSLSELARRGGATTTTNPGGRPQPAVVGRVNQPGLAPLLAQRPPARQRAAAPADPPGRPAATGKIAYQPAPAPQQHVDSLPADVQAHYKRLNLAQTRATRPAFIDDDVIDPPSYLAAGRFNRVFSVKLRGLNGEPLDRVFKPLAAVEKGWVAERTGIDLRNPQTAMRNLATLAYAQRLGFDVIPDMKVGLLTLPGPGSPQPQLGLVMERAPGHSARMTSLPDLRRGDVARETTKLQLLDHLTGQGDRHSENYFIHIDPQSRVKVTGIDNDQCFGHKAHRPDAMRPDFTSFRLDRIGFNGTGLPKFIDTEMAKAVTSVTPEHLHEMLVDKLSAAEVQAAVKRLEGVKAHVAQLSQQGKVLSPQAWEQRFSTTVNPSWDDGYAQRDLLAAAGRLRGNRAAL
jgi:hypothetical protein